MENANPPLTLDPPVLPTTQRTNVVQELDELQAISAYIDSRLENIEHFLNDFVNPPNEIDMDDLDPDDESVDASLVSPFLDLDDDSDDGEFVAYFDPFLPMNIITRKAYNTIIVDKLESTGVNLVSIVRDVYVFIGSFTYVTDFVVLEDTGEFILRDMAEVMIGKPLREVTKLEYDCAKGLMSFTRIFDTYTFQIPRTIPRSRIPSRREYERVAYPWACEPPRSHVIFDEKKPESSLEFHLDDPWMEI
ncbi:hypothetical protein Tco_1447413 [Tanacetum coccineum]